MCDLWVKLNQSQHRRQSFLGTMFKMAVSINTQLDPDGSQEENVKFSQITTLSSLFKIYFACTKLNETFYDLQNKHFNLHEVFFNEKFVKNVLFVSFCKGKT